MPSWLFITISTTNFISILGLWIIFRKINEASRRQIHIIGEINKELVLTPTLLILKILYLIIVIGLAGLSYYLL